MPDAAATAYDDRWTDGRALLRAADSPMAALVDAEPELNPDVLFDGRLDLEHLRGLDDDAARAELTQVKGVGRFTADGVLMLRYEDGRPPAARPLACPTPPGGSTTRRPVRAACGSARRSAGAS